VPRSRSSSVNGAAWYLTGAVIALLFLLPLILLLLTVFKTPEGAAATPPSYLPKPFSLKNFSSMFSGDTNLWPFVRNSFVAAIGTVIGTVLVSLLAGFGFARFSFPGKGVLFALVLTIFMVPFQSILTPLYLVLKYLHLNNSLLGLVLVYMTFQLPFGIFIMRNSFASIPSGIYEAATVDGAGTLRSLRSVLLPLVRPGIITVALFAFIAAWNEFLAALVLLSGGQHQTLPVELLNLVTGQFGVINWGVLETGVLISMAPCVLLFVALQKYYVGGVLSGSVR
jgi:multiple sugar transport system permease protein